MKEKAFPEIPTLGPSSPSKHCVLTLRLAHATLKLFNGYVIWKIHASLENASMPWKTLAFGNNCACRLLTIVEEAKLGDALMLSKRAESLFPMKVFIPQVPLV